jgi:opacity protein-like surface antigen
MQLRRAVGAASSLLATVLVALLIAPSAPAAPQPVPNPTVYGPIEGGIKGYPWNHSLYELRGRGFDYTEREYFFSGTASQSASGSGLSAPYESRMLVRLPRDRSDFSGAVVVEWLSI